VTSVTCNTGYCLNAFTLGTAASYSAATCSICGTGGPSSGYLSCSSSCTSSGTVSGCTASSLVCVANFYYLSAASTCTLCSTTVTNAYSC